jgi:O-antigen ligase
MLESKARLKKIGWAIGIFLLVFCVVATKSRGGTLALGAILFYLWLKSQRKVLGAAVAVAAVLLTLALAPSAYLSRMNTMFDSEESSAASRVEAWRKGTQMAIQSPLLGVGAGHFPIAYGGVTMGRWMTAHSIYFLLLGELGFPGLTILLSLIFYNLWANRRLLDDIRDLPPDKKKSCRNALVCTNAALVSFAVGGAFLSAAYYPHLYVVCGLMTATRRVVRSQIALRTHEPAASHAPKRDVRPDLISAEWVPRPGFATSAGRPVLHGYEKP